MFAFVVGAWLGLSIIVGVCAAKKDLNGSDYFLLSLILSPFVGFAVVMLKSKKKGR